MDINNSWRNCLFGSLYLFPQYFKNALQIKILRWSVKALNLIQLYRPTFISKYFPVSNETPTPSYVILLDKYVISFFTCSYQTEISADALAKVNIISPEYEFIFSTVPQSPFWINLPTAALIIFHHGRVAFRYFWELCRCTLEGFGIERAEMGAIRVIFAGVMVSAAHGTRFVGLRLCGSSLDGVCLIHRRFGRSAYHCSLRKYSWGCFLVETFALRIHKGVFWFLSFIENETKTFKCGSGHGSIREQMTERYNISKKKDFCQKYLFYILIWYKISQIKKKSRSWLNMELILHIRNFAVWQFQLIF